MARQTAVINIIAIGMTLVIISGGVDLSVGAVLALCGICGTLLMEKGMGSSAGHDSWHSDRGWLGFVDGLDHHDTFGCPRSSLHWVVWAWREA